MLYLLETLNKVKPEDLERHITIDIPELPSVLPKLKAGSGLAVDEQTDAVGEGSYLDRGWLKVVRRKPESGKRYPEVNWVMPAGREFATKSLENGGHPEISSGP